MANFGKNIAKKVNAQPGGIVATRNVITSSNVTVAAQDLTAPATDRLEILNIVVETDATGLAGATTFQVTKKAASYANGLVVLGHAVASLGAATAVDLSTATTKQRVILEAGENLQFNGTVGAGTGAGKVRIVCTFRKLADAADIKAKPTS